MADPHHVPELDAHDMRTVILYRVGLTVAAFSVFWGGLARIAMTHLDDPAQWMALGVSAGVACCVVNLHLYNKRIRWVIGASTLFGLWLLSCAFATQQEEFRHLLLQGAVGFCFVTLSALALKEQFCFRIPGLKWVPVFLASSVLFGVGKWSILHGVALLPAGLLLLVLCVAKWRMPLGHDIGNKAHYEV